MSRHVEGESLMGEGTTIFEGMPAPDTSKMTAEQIAEAKRLSEQLKDEASKAATEDRDGAASIQEALQNWDKRNAA